MNSKTICLVLALCVAALALPQPDLTPETRMVGGTPTTIEQFPYIVAFIYFYPGPGIYVQRCVGSLISSYHVLTTAYCFTAADLNFMLIRAGSTNSMSGGVLSTINNVVKHPFYVESPRQADIAITILNFPLIPSQTIQILYLPPQNAYIPDGTEVKVVSWGFVSEQGPQLETLSTVILNKLPLLTCQMMYTGNNAVAIDDPVICASQPGPVGMCLGDSGAPMVIDNVVVGLSSFYQDCGNNAYPDVFTRIDRYTNWIIEASVPPSRSSDASAAFSTEPRIQNSPQIAQ